VPKGDRKRACDILKAQVPDLVGSGGDRIAAKRMFQLLAGENINIQLISTSEIKISCVIARKYAELAVQCLHEGFGLSHPPGERPGM
jgi:aspartate kinase